MRATPMAAILLMACRSEPAPPTPAPSAAPVASAPQASAPPVASAAEPPRAPPSPPIPGSTWRLGLPTGWRSVSYYKMENQLALERGDPPSAEIRATVSRAPPSKSWIDQMTLFAGAFGVKWDAETEGRVGVGALPAQITFGQGKSMKSPSRDRRVMRVVARIDERDVLFAVASWEGTGAEPDVSAILGGLASSAP